MPGRDLHSRMVGWLKVALPLAALVILSTLFLLSGESTYITGQSLVVDGGLSSLR